MSKTCGSIILAGVLKSLGVDTIFYLPGGPMSLTTETSSQLGIRLIDVRDERAAAMAAHAYARVTGKPGVCITGAGADTTNLTTGITNAFLDCCPVVALCGSISSEFQARHAFQEVDQLGIMKSITKHAWRVPSCQRIPDFVSTAFRHALADNLGPVYLEFPANVLNKVEEVEGEVEIPPAVPFKNRPAGDPGLVKEAVETLARAERPIILSGSGILWSEASAELQEFVDATGIPFYTTPISRGVIPEDHPLCFPGARSLAWREADTVLLVGTRPGFVVSFLEPPRFHAKARIIAVNIDAGELGHNRPIEVGIQGDAKAVLKQLTEEARKRFGNKPVLPWVERLRKADLEQLAKASPLLNSDKTPIHPLRLCKEIRDFLPRDTILVVDGNIILHHARHSIPSYYPRHRLNPGPSGCMGCGVPFGVGAKAARPEKPVMVLTGDGAFGFHAMEMDTAIRHKLPIVVVVSNNGGWGGSLGTQTQPEKRLGFTRYDKVVEALGGHSEFVEQPQDIRKALERAFACGKAALVNVITDPLAEAATQDFARLGSRDVREVF